MSDIATDFYLMSAWQNVISQSTQDAKRREEEESHTKSDTTSAKNNGNKRTPSFDELRAGYDDDTDTSAPGELKIICEPPSISW